MRSHPLWSVAPHRAQQMCRNRSSSRHRNCLRLLPRWIPPGPGPRRRREFHGFKWNKRSGSYLCAFNTAATTTSSSPWQNRTAWHIIQTERLSYPKCTRNTHTTSPHAQLSSSTTCRPGRCVCGHTRGHIPCASLTPLPFPDGRRNVEHVQAGPQLVVTGGENTFFANVPHSPCMYRWLKLQPKYEAEVRRAQLALKLPTDYFGLHVRWMENKCRWALGKAHARAYEKHNLPKPDFLQDIFPMCQMQPNYYRKFWNHTGNFFVAHDHQSDAAFYRKLVRDGAVFYASFKGFSALQGDEAMLLDFWLLVGAKVFVGNAMSTLSMNVCGVRTALGRQCDNMQLMAKMYPCFLHPDFDKAFNVTT
eukprot:GGOE01046540.1.p1 GENE.GGOE01046540.1~~GGOE01046540.1.p1  ORF type:complete len:362 (+),score=29.38 GGOE01046540.1:186-1271(+)